MSIIEWGDPDKDLTKKNYEAIVQAITNKLHSRAIEAYIFGSFAHKTHGPDSDIDIAIVTQTELPFIERGVLFNDLREIYRPMDILVYTPEEFERMKNEPNGFISNARLLKII